MVIILCLAYTTRRDVTRKFSYTDSWISLFNVSCLVHLCLIYSTWHWNDAPTTSDNSVIISDIDIILWIIHIRILIFVVLIIPSLIFLITFSFMKQINALLAILFIFFFSLFVFGFADNISTSVIVTLGISLSNCYSVF